MASVSEPLQALVNDLIQNPSFESAELSIEHLQIMQRTAELQQDKTARLKELSEKAESDGDISFSDLGSMMSGFTEAAGLQTSEIEVVKSAGGNWAEHQWVRESLRTAWIQKDINDTVAHNFDLYQKYEEQLSLYIAP